MQKTKWLIKQKGLISGIVNAKDCYHQIGKPTKVMEELLAICEPNSLILDPFAGSALLALRVVI